jgi:hypothetical protein
MMRFMHLGAEIGLKPMPSLNLNWIQTLHIETTFGKKLKYGSSKENIQDLTKEDDGLSD